MALVIPEHYDPVLSVRETQEAIKFIRDLFQKEFGRQMNLERVSAPLFVTENSGLNDNLNGVERPVNFDLLSLPGENIEVVQSLAKWKRLALKRYGFKPGEGLYTNMNAIRRDEEPDNLHSCYVDQWDWERVIRKEDRSIEVLEDTVQRIFTIIKHMQHEVWYKYPDACYRLPEGARNCDCARVRRCLCGAHRRRALKRRAPRPPRAGLRRLELKRRHSLLV